ncbi:MAG TPA: IS1595 family transposase [Solirubrobacteraceae bacterium]|nr:IS1595 family transposase [Solirubrobacteraceae bacterium]
MSDRNNPTRGSASTSTYSFMEFMRDFPDDATCLDHLWRRRYSSDGQHADCPKCGQERSFYRVQARPSYACGTCGFQFYPLAGTIFHRSSTSLHLWFYAIHLMTSTRCGVSAKQLERELGVTYKTAWRMFNLIRNKLMAEDDGPLSGEVEIDETSVDGKPRKPYGPRKRRTRSESLSDAVQLAERRRATVFAAVERGGRVKATVLPSRRGPRLRQQAVEWVQPDAIVYTDEWPYYNKLGEDFAAHKRIRHGAGEYVIGDVHTNTIEGFFGNLKPSIKGTYRVISHKWLQGYLNEFMWRYNHRHDRRAMFLTLVDRAAIKV